LSNYYFSTKVAWRFSSNDGMIIEQLTGQISWNILNLHSRKLSACLRLLT